MASVSDELIALNTQVAQLLANVQVSKDALDSVGPNAAQVAADTLQVAADRATVEAAEAVVVAAEAATTAARDQSVAAKNASEAAAEASGDVLFFDTKALAVAALPLTEGQVLRVFSDESKSGGQVFYRVESGALVEKLDADERTTTSNPALARFSISVPRSTLGLVEIGGSLSIGDSVMTGYLQDALDEIANPASRFKRLFIDAVPEDDGFWGINQTLVLGNGTEIEGAGYTSRIRNTLTGGLAGAGRIFDIGNMNTADYTAAPTWAIDPAAAGDTAVSLVTPGDAADFEPGEIVWFRTAEVASGTIYSRLLHREVETVNAGTGVVTFRRPLEYDIAGSAPVISKNDGVRADPFGTPRRLVKRPIIKNLRLDTAEDGQWQAAGGIYEGRLSNLWIDSHRAIYGNAFLYSRFQSITSSFNDRILEFGGYSQGTVVDTLDAYYVDHGIAPTSEPLIAFGENSNFNVLQNVQIEARGCAEGRLWRALHGSDNIIQNVQAHVEDLVTGSCLEISPTAGVDCERNVFRRAEVWANPVYFIDYIANAAAVTDSNRVEDVNFHGTPSVGAMRLSIAENPVVRRIEVDSGAVVFQPGATNPTVEDFRTRARHHSVSSTLSKAVSGAVDNGSGAIRLTVTAHSFVTGNVIEVRDVGGVPAANGSWPITVIDANTIDLVGSVFSGAFSSAGTAVWRVAGSIKGLRSGSSDDLARASRNLRELATSSTTEVVLAELTLPADTLSAGDEIVADILALISGTAGTKNIRVRANGVAGTLLGAVSMVAADSGYMRFSVLLSNIFDTTTKRVYASQPTLGTLSTKGAGLAFNSDASPLKLTITGQVSSASDSIRLGVDFRCSREFG